MMEWISTKEKETNIYTDEFQVDSTLNAGELNISFLSCVLSTVPSFQIQYKGKIIYTN